MKLCLVIILVIGVTSVHQIVCTDFLDRAAYLVRQLAMVISSELSPSPESRSQEAVRKSDSVAEGIRLHTPLRRHKIKMQPILRAIVDYDTSKKASNLWWTKTEQSIESILAMYSVSQSFLTRSQNLLNKAVILCSNNPLKRKRLERSLAHLTQAQLTMDQARYEYNTVQQNFYTATRSTESYNSLTVKKISPLIKVGSEMRRPGPCLLQELTQQREMLDRQLAKQWISCELVSGDEESCAIL